MKHLILGEVGRFGVNVTFCHLGGTRINERDHGWKSGGGKCTSGLLVGAVTRCVIHQGIRPGRLKSSWELPVMPELLGLRLAEGVTFCNMPTQRGCLVHWDTTGNKIDKTICFHKPYIPLARER